MVKTFFEERWKYSQPVGSNVYRASPSQSKRSEVSSTTCLRSDAAMTQSGKPLLSASVGAQFSTQASSRRLSLSSTLCGQRARVTVRAFLMQILRTSQQIDMQILFRQGTGSECFVCHHIDSRARWTRWRRLVVFENSMNDSLVHPKDFSSTFSQILDYHAQRYPQCLWLKTKAREEQTIEER